MNWFSMMLAVLLLQSATPARPQDRATINGIVLKAGTGDPLSKATITLNAVNGGRAQSFTATTTTGGQFSFQNLEPGQYRLSATRSGYVRMEYGARNPGRPGLAITVNAGQRVNDVVIQLTPAGTITGRVFDRDGEPLANVTVEALKYSYQEGHRVMNVVQTARTNDLGEYRLFWVAPGQYYVSATPQEGPRTQLQNPSAVAGPGIGGELGSPLSGARGNRGGGGGSGGRGAPTPTATPAVERSNDATEGYVPVYYPGTTDAQSAGAITVTPNSVFSGVDLTVTRVRTLRVRGQIVNGVTGQLAANNANVMLLPVNRGSAGGGFRGGIRNPGNLRNGVVQGAFEISGVVPGSYELIGIINDRNNRMTARLPVEVGNSNVENVSLVATPGVSLTGRLVIEGAQSTGTQDITRMRVMLRPDSAAQIAGGPPGGPVQADGTFKLDQVGRDDYRLSVTGMPRNAYVKMARYGSTDVMNDGLRIDRQPNGALEILVSTNTGTLDGLVQNEKQEPSINVTVVLVPEVARRGRLDLYRTISTDATGHFHLEGVPPGDYRVFSWEDVEPGAWQDPEFIRQFEDRGRPVRIPENGASTIELRVIPAGV